MRDRQEDTGAVGRANAQTLYAEGWLLQQLQQGLSGIDGGTLSAAELPHVFVSEMCMSAKCSFKPVEAYLAFPSSSLELDCDPVSENIRFAFPITGLDSMMISLL